MGNRTLFQVWENRVTAFVFLAAAFLVASIGAHGCTAQSNVRNDEDRIIRSINLPEGQKLITVSCDEGYQIWYLTRPMRADEAPETYTFKRDAIHGPNQAIVLYEVVSTEPK